MSQGISRSIAVVTGACGGLGKELARSFGEDFDLILADVRHELLDAFANELYEDGYTVAGVLAGDIGTSEYNQKLAQLVTEKGRVGAILHAAGLSRSMSDWKTILRVNQVGTILMLDALEPLLDPGAVCVMIASQAAHVAKRNPQIDEILVDALSPDLYDRIEPLFAASPEAEGGLGMSWAAYAYGKRAMIRLAETRAKSWGSIGARICTISPGVMWTPMARSEMENSGGAGQLLDATPIGRWGTPMDIARAARFLASKDAAYISGADLRVDGGATPAWVGPCF